MPIPIEQALQGEDVEVIRRKKIDTEKLIELLKSNAYTVAELADLFGVKVNTMRTKIYQLKKNGVPIVSKRLDGKVYYFIHED